MHPMPLLQLYGTNDFIVNINGSEFYLSADSALNYWADVNTCLQVDTIQLTDLIISDGSTVTKVTYSDCNEQSEVVYLKIENGGHQWPGASYEIIGWGNRNMDINTGNEILNFFNNFTLN
jgi:polyhydroxybutyrate depolymerase